MGHESNGVGESCSVVAEIHEFIHLVTFAVGKKIEYFPDQCLAYSILVVGSSLVAAVCTEVSHPAVVLSLLAKIVEKKSAATQVVVFGIVDDRHSTLHGPVMHVFIHSLWYYKSL